MIVGEKQERDSSTVKDSHGEEGGSEQGEGGMEWGFWSAKDYLVCSCTSGRPSLGALLCGRDSAFFEAASVAL